MEMTKEAYKAKMEAQLKLWNARLDGLRAKAETISAEAKIELAKQTDELKAFETSAKKHIAEVEAAAAESWHKVRGGIEQTWSQLSGSVEAIWAKLAPDAGTKN